MSFQVDSVVETQLKNEVILIDLLVLAQQLDLHVGRVEHLGHLDDLANRVPEEKVALCVAVQVLG